LNAERGIYIDKDFGFDHRRSGKHVSVFAIWFEFGMQGVKQRSGIEI
jgi:hypothetical protein